MTDRPSFTADNAESSALDPFRDELETIEEMLANGERAAAAARCRELLKVDPAAPEVLFLLVKATKDSVGGQLEGLEKLLPLFTRDIGVYWRLRRYAERVSQDPVLRTLLAQISASSAIQVLDLIADDFTRAGELWAQADYPGKSATSYYNAGVAWLRANEQEAAVSCFLESGLARPWYFWIIAASDELPKIALAKALERRALDQPVVEVGESDQQPGCEILHALVAELCDKPTSLSPAVVEQAHAGAAMPAVLLATSIVDAQNLLINQGELADDSKLEEAAELLAQVSEADVPGISVLHALTHCTRARAAHEPSAKDAALEEARVLLEVLAETSNGFDVEELVCHLGEGSSCRDIYVSCFVRRVAQ